MKRNSPIALFVVTLTLFGIQAQAQSNTPDPQTRPRIVSQVAQQNKPQTPAESATNLPAAATASNEGASEPLSNEADKRTASPLTQLTPGIIQARINEAQRLLKSRPLATAMTTPSIEFVTVAALDRKTSRTHLVTLSKETFLKKGSEITLPSSLGTPLTIRVLRANGVNTALNIFDSEGRAFVPLPEPLSGRQGPP